MKTLKKINSANHNGFITNDAIGTNSLSFHIDLPKNVVVDHIRIKGSFKVNGVNCENAMIEDIETPVVFVPHRELAYKAHNPDRMQRVAATAYFLDGIPQELLEKVQAGEICDFEVYYHEEFVAEVE